MTHVQGYILKTSCYIFEIDISSTSLYFLIEFSELSIQ